MLIMPQAPNLLRSPWLQDPVPGPTGCQSAPGMTQRVHLLIRLVSKEMPDCERGEQDLMADAVPESIMHEPVQPPRQLVHPLGRYRLRTPDTPPGTAMIQATDIPPSPGTLTDLHHRQLGFTTCEAARGLREQQRMDGSEEAPNCRDFIRQCSSRAVASSFTTGPPSDSSPFIKENHMKKGLLAETRKYYLWS